MGKCEASAVPKQQLPLSPEMKGLPTRLQYALDHCRKTAQKIGEESGVDPSQLSENRLRERLRGISANQLVHLARALGVRVGWLIADEQPIFPDPDDRGPLVLTEVPAEDVKGEKERKLSRAPSVRTTPKSYRRKT
jgi:transcriptional regulator with XRE-family HTH domain